MREIKNTPNNLEEWSCHHCVSETTYPKASKHGLMKYMSKELVRHCSTWNRVCLRSSKTIWRHHRAFESWMRRKRSRQRNRFCHSEQFSQRQQFTSPKEPNRFRDKLDLQFQWHGKLVDLLRLQRAACDSNELLSKIIEPWSRIKSCVIAVSNDGTENSWTEIHRRDNNDLKASYCQISGGFRAVRVRWNRRGLR